MLIVGISRIYGRMYCVRFYFAGLRWLAEVKAVVAP